MSNHPPPRGKKYSIMVGLEGAKGKDEAKWSSRCGALIRCHIPIGYDEWRNVDDYYKENLWKELLVFIYFDPFIVNNTDNITNIINWKRILKLILLKGLLHYIENSCKRQNWKHIVRS